jgi:hypothetical protein
VVLDDQDAWRRGIAPAQVAGGRDPEGRTIQLGGPAEGLIGGRVANAEHGDLRQRVGQRPEAKRTVDGLTRIRSRGGRKV